MSLDVNENFEYLFPVFKWIVYLNICKLFFTNQIQMRVQNLPELWIRVDLYPDPHKFERIFYLEGRPNPVTGPIIYSNKNYMAQNAPPPSPNTNTIQVFYTNMVRVNKSLSLWVVRR